MTVYTMKLTRLYTKLAHKTVVAAMKDWQQNYYFLNTYISKNVMLLLIWMKISSHERWRISRKTLFNLKLKLFNVLM